MEEILEIIKNDLGLTSTAKDGYLNHIIDACTTELSKKFKLDQKDIEDVMLLADYVAWRYRNRIGGSAMPQNLRYRIRNRSIRERKQNGTVEG